MLSGILGQEETMRTTITSLSTLLLYASISSVVFAAAPVPQPSEPSVVVPAPPKTSATQPATPPAHWAWAQTPPMGWNSWDCFGAGVTEDQTLENADYINKNLKSHGYSIITVDIQWYEPQAHTDQYRKGAVLEMDANGRLLPAPNRFPSTKDSRSFKPLADKIHAMGLKFGVHLLRGIPRQAVDQNTPILGTQYHAADIANKTDVCRWNTDMYGVDMSKPGAQEYYDSVFALLASWEIDLVKVDDLSAPRYHQAEVEAIRKAIDKTGRSIVFSTSPGATPLASGDNVMLNANMWRISNDFWDNWRALKEQFKRLDDWTPYRGPGHFPDADMLPVGNIRAWRENDAWTHFSHDDLQTLMTLWCMARSPLILGGNMPKNDDFTLAVISNDDVLAIDQHSVNNRQLWRSEDLVVWTADVPDSKDRYVAFFNAKELPRQPGPATPGQAAPAYRIAPQPSTISLAAKDVGLGKFSTVRDLWKHEDHPLKDSATLTVELLPHCSALFKVSP
jgi:hypothetical protein